MSIITIATTDSKSKGIRDVILSILNDEQTAYTGDVIAVEGIVSVDIPTEQSETPIPANDNPEWDVNTPPPQALSATMVVRGIKYKDYKHIIGIPQSEPGKGTRFGQPAKKKYFSLATTRTFDDNTQARIVFYRARVSGSVPQINQLTISNDFTMPEVSLPLVITPLFAKNNIDFEYMNVFSSVDDAEAFTVHKTTIVFPERLTLLNNPTKEA